MWVRIPAVTLVHVHVVGGYVRYISPHITCIIIINMTYSFV